MLSPETSRVAADGRKGGRGAVVPPERRSAFRVMCRNLDRGRHALFLQGLAAPSAAHPALGARHSADKSYVGSPTPSSVAKIGAIRLFIRLAHIRSGSNSRPESDLDEKPHAQVAKIPKLYESFNPSTSEKRMIGLGCQVPGKRSSRALSGWILLAFAFVTLGVQAVAGISACCGGLSCQCESCPLGVPPASRDERPVERSDSACHSHSGARVVEIEASSTVFGPTEPHSHPPSSPPCCCAGNVWVTPMTGIRDAGSDRISPRRTLTAESQDVGSSLERPPPFSPRGPPFRHLP